MATGSNPNQVDTRPPPDPEKDVTLENVKTRDKEANAHHGRVALTRTTTGPPHSIFTFKQRRFIVIMASAAGFFSPLSANIYFPALNSLAADLHVSNSLINLRLTSYMIFQGIAPTFFGDLADMGGRRPAYIIGFVIYMGACVGIALQNKYAALFVLRCLQSAGSSSTIALASGVVSDVVTAAERGSWMGYVTAGSLLGPSVC